MRLDFEKMFERWQKESKENLKNRKTHYQKKSDKKRLNKKRRDFENGKNKKRKY